MKNEFNTLATFILTAWNDGVKTPFTFLGKPGIGKTALGRYVAVLMTEQVQNSNPSAEPAISQVLDLSSMLPEDLLGLPYRDGEVTKYAAQEWLAELCEPGSYGVLVLDDLPAAAPSVQVAARQIVLERRVHSHYLSDGVVIIVTGNRREDKSNASTLPAHFRNSVCMMPINPGLDEWIQWYGKQLGLHPDVPSFLNYRPTHLSQTPKDADEERGSFATPRTWAKLGEMWATARKFDENIQINIARGCVGKGPATEFVSFINVKKNLVDPMEVLRNPKKAIPNPRAYLNSPDKVYAMVTAIAEHGYSNKMGLEYITALGWCSDGNKEYISASINHWKAFGEKDAMPMLVRAIRKAGGDECIKPVMEWLEKVHG